MTLQEMLPQNYQHSDEITDTQKAINQETEKALSAKDDLLLQLNVETATWGLDLWEKAYGISTDVSRTYNFRRNRIKSKMRSRGTTTVEMIQNAAESFINGDAEVIEHPQNYMFDIQFDATQQIPSNLAGLTAVIEEIKPAHLAYAYAYLFLTRAWAGTFQTSGTALTIYPYVAGSLTTMAAAYSGGGCFAASDILIQPKGGEE